MVLFTSNRPLERAENIKAVYDAYDGEKEFFQVNPLSLSPILTSNNYALRVSDEFIRVSPGKAIVISHGIVGGKLVGVDQPHPFHFARYAHLMDYVVTSSTKLIPLVAKQSAVPEEKVLPLGMPRTDIFFKPYKRKNKKRTYLFCPTYRAKEETPFPYIDWATLDNCLSDDEQLIVKPHMMSPPFLNREYKHIIEVSNTLPSGPYLMDCDVLITDYSTIMFDAMLLKKPVVLFEKVQGYLKTRGMYLDYPNGYTTRYATNEAELLNLLWSAQGQNEAEARCCELVADACDGHSSERVCKLIKEIV